MRRHKSAHTQTHARGSIIAVHQITSSSQFVWKPLHDLSSFSVCFCPLYTIICMRKSDGWETLVGRSGKVGWVFEGLGFKRRPLTFELHCESLSAGRRCLDGNVRDSCPRLSWNVARGSTVDRCCTPIQCNMTELCGLDGKSDR